jgi:hypothetical protein
MFHYFEHTVDPTAELAAAREVLQPDGLLVIEVPNPECRLARLLGKYWICWLQPQHQHLVPIDGMRKLLDAAGFEPLHWQVREAHIPVDFLLAVELLRNRIGGFPPLPWRRRPTLFDRLRYGAAFVPYVLLLAAAFSMDRAVARVFRWTGDSNAYRVVARKKPTQTEP